jgi:hypothetical protein
MKVACPKCQKVLQAPDEWAGKTVKCPSCKRQINLPTIISEDEPDLSFDMNSLDSVEDAGEAMQRKRGRRKMKLKEAQAAAETDEPGDPHVRVCPTCRQKIKNDDVYLDLICRNCGGAVPGLDSGDRRGGRYTSALTGRLKADTSFYTGFGSAILYPIRGLDSVLKATGIALAAIAVPLLGVLAFTQSAQLNDAEAAKRAGADSAAWVGIFLTVAFVVEAIYFGAVAYYVLIDTIRTTSSGSERAATITWNVVNLGAALGGYIALIIFYALIALALIGGVPTGWGPVQTALSSPGKLFVIALLTFGVPMNILGLSSGHPLDGLNPIRVFHSIAKVIGHYIFLFLIVLLYLGLYMGLTVGVMGWVGPFIRGAMTQGLATGFVRMIIGIAAWAGVIGVGFYFAYSMGRILGLFSRSYRNQLLFDL